MNCKIQIWLHGGPGGCKQRHPVDDAPGRTGRVPVIVISPLSDCLIEINLHPVYVSDTKFVWVLLCDLMKAGTGRRYHPDQSKTLQIVTQSTFSLMRWTSTGSQQLVFWCALHLYIHMDLSNVPRRHLTSTWAMVGLQQAGVHQAGDGVAAFSTSKALVTFTLEGSTTKIE